MSEAKRQTEHFQREEIVRHVAANARIEGVSLSESARTVLAHWAAGEISTDDLQAWKKERIRQAKEKHPSSVTRARA